MANKKLIDNINDRLFHTMLIHVWILSYGDIQQFVVNIIIQESKILKSKIYVESLIFSPDFHLKHIPS